MIALPSPLVFELLAFGAYEETKFSKSKEERVDGLRTITVRESQ